MEIPSAIIGSMVTYLIVPVQEHLGSLIFCRRYKRDMDTKKKSLDATKNSAMDNIHAYNTNSLIIPTEIIHWDKEVSDLDALVESFPSEVGSCFNLSNRYKVGRKALRISQEINRLKEEYSKIHWPKNPIPLGKVDMSTSTLISSASAHHHNDFKSRQRIFMKALKSLEQDHSCHMIALCGMAGVGKTTMMQNLKKAVIEKKMFHIIIEVVIKEKMRVHAIQQTVAEFMGMALTEVSEEARVIKLRNGFESLCNQGKDTFLIILDDVWEALDLTVIGLSSFPNQGVNFKVLLTSRDRGVCTSMGVNFDSILNVDIIEDAEAQIYFFGFIKNPVDRHLQLLGKRIAIKCHGLPIAIKTIAITLNGKGKHVWEDTLGKLEVGNVEQVVSRIFAMSYNNLPDDQETGLTLMLCGLFPEDYSITIEDLVTYSWNVELFTHLRLREERRNRLKTCIDRLIYANLLLESQQDGYVKMHNLVHGFVSELRSGHKLVRSGDKHVVMIGKKTKSLLSRTKCQIDEQLRRRLI